MRARGAICTAEFFFASPENALVSPPHPSLLAKINLLKLQNKADLQFKIKLQVIL